MCEKSFICFICDYISSKTNEFVLKKKVFSITILFPLPNLLCGKDVEKKKCFQWKEKNWKIQQQRKKCAKYPNNKTSMAFFIQWQTEKKTFEQKEKLADKLNGCYGKNLDSNCLIRSLKPILWWQSNVSVSGVCL